MTIRIRSLWHVVAVLGLLHAGPAPAVESALTFKLGSYDLSKTDQEIASDDHDFQKKSDDLFGVEWERRLSSKPRLALGVDVFRFQNRFERENGEDETMYAIVGLAKAKYFLADGAFQPYVGAGVGIATVHDSGGPIEGVASGLAFQGVIGIQFRFDRIGLRLEYAPLYSRVEDTKDGGDEVDASSGGLFFGLTVHLGGQSP